MLEGRNTWERVLKRLEGTIAARSFQTWLKPTRLISEDAQRIRVRVPNAWFAEWLRTNYLEAILEALRGLDRGEAAVEFVPEDPPPRRTEDPPPAPASFGLNPRYTFDTFVVSSCNEFAHAAARAIVEQRPHTYNPMFIYGGAGLGKTHLIQAIGNALCSNGAANLRYVTSETFVNEVINAIRFDRTMEFKQRYRGLDLLLLDDVQFLAGKERSLVEFFHTFNALYNAQKQIVITSDCPPREIPFLEERLRSRFEWGLIADIQPPDLETKVAILRKKAEREGTPLPDEVALFIASHSTSNIRELEGLLCRVQAYAAMRGRLISRELAKECLRDLLRPNPPSVTVESIQKVVADYYNISVAELKARTQTRQVSFPRQVAMYLCKRLSGSSYCEIARRFGGKHHTTVLHAVKRIEEKVQRERDFARLIDGFIQSLG